MYILTRTFLADERGATAIEYGLIASLICLAILGALSATGGGVAAKWQYVMEKVSNAIDGGG